MSYYTIEKEHCSKALVRNIDEYPHGIVISVNKPYGWTSSDVVRKIKFRAQRFFGVKNIKVGHAGTLDPLATGVLIICLGKATKLAEMLQKQEKEYVAGITFGCTTPSFDLEKEIDTYYPFEHITIDSIKSIFPGFIGEQDQIPPIFSAKLVDGNRSYELARAGVEKELKPSRVTIYSLEAISFISPLLTLRIRCSKGTYIRSLARDLGIALESGAHLSDLVRTSSGGFSVINSVTIEDLENLMKID
ncbi:MAG: tRNA pseudouridine(55) synthase TruB [Bacteroidales bacterium]|jgi:tRNA pseudouridine55 synthase